MKASPREKRLVAVLGGAGAMGRATVFDLARSGHPVLLLDADPAASAPHRPALRGGPNHGRHRRCSRSRSPGGSAADGPGRGRRQLRALHLQPAGDGGGASRALPLPGPGRPLPHHAGPAHPRRGLPPPRPPGRARHGKRARHRQRPGPGRRRSPAPRACGASLQRRRRPHALRGARGLRLLAGHRARRVHAAAHGLREGSLSRGRAALGRRGLLLRDRAPARAPEPAFRGGDPAPVVSGQGHSRVLLQDRLRSRAHRATEAADRPGPHLAGRGPPRRRPPRRAARVLQGSRQAAGLHRRSRQPGRGRRGRGRKGSGDGPLRPHRAAAASAPALRGGPRHRLSPAIVAHADPGRPHPRAWRAAARARVPVQPFLAALAERGMRPHLTVSRPL